MSSIDNRIVNMEFNNKGFESGVATTLNSLKKLNESLKMKTETSGFNKISEGITNLKNNGLSGLSSGVETVSAKFSALSVIGATALANITNSALNAGKKIANALVLDPITTGFSEYETKVNSISTILANTADEGATIESVTAALDELNKYSDDTIYNFAQMTDNIGKFTAAGVSLEDSVASIKGLSNLAALFGVDSTRAAGAMYQMSQALAAGKVQLADWRSLVNAGMSGEAFQEALIRTSEQMGTGAKAMIEKYGSFNESLTKGEWLTGDVMIETLKQLSGAYKESELRAQGYSATQAKAIVDMANTATKAATEVRTLTGMWDAMKESVQSGWAISWEHILGNKDQATELLTNVKNAFDAIIKPSTEARNEMLKFWNESGGRDATIRGLTNIVQSLGKGLGAVGDAWKEVFPSMTGKKLTELSTKFRDLTYKFKMNDEVAGKIKNTFKGVFDVFKSLGTMVGNIAKAMTPLGKVFSSIGSTVLTVASSLGKSLSNISKTLSDKVFDKMGDGLNKTFTKIGESYETLKTKMGDFFNSLKDVDISKMFGSMGSMLKPVGTALTSIGEGLGKSIGSINFDTIFKGLQTVSGLKLIGTIKDIFGELGNVTDSLSKVTKSITDVFKNFGEIGTSIVETLGQTKEALVSWQQDIKAKTLLKIAGAVAVLAASLVLLSSIDAKQLAVGLGGMAAIFASLAIAYGHIGKMGGLKGMLSINTAIATIAASMLLMAIGLKTLSTINIDEMMVGIVGLAASFLTMKAAIKGFGGGKDLAVTAQGLIVFGVALMSIAGALKLLGSIDSETLGGGLFAMLAVLIELSVFLKYTKFYTLSTEAAKGILLVSAAMLVMAAAVKSFGNIDADSLITGLAGMAAVLLELGLLSKFGGDGGNMVKLGLGLTIMGAAMLVMAKAIQSLGSGDWTTLARGLTALAGALSILGIAADLIQGGDMAKLALGLGAMGASLLIISAALNSFGSMTWDQLAVGLTALAGSLAILGITMFAISDGRMLLGAAAILVLSAAMAVLTPQVVAMSNLSWEQVAIGLTAFAGALAILGIAGLAATAVAPGLAILAATAAIIGVGCAAAGAGIALMGTGLGALAAVIAASGFAVIEFIRQLIGLLPQIGLKAGEAMVNFAGAISEGAPQIIAAFSTLLEAILTSIRNNIPLIAQTGVDLVLAFGKSLAEGIPQLVTYGLQMILGILEGIRDNIYQITDAAIDTVTEFVNAVSDNLGQVIDAGIDLALDFIEGVADGISNNKDRLEAAVEKAINAMIDAGVAVITGSYNAFQEKGRELLNSLVKGMNEKLDAGKKAVEDAIDRAKQGAKNCGTALVQAGRDLIAGLKKGIEEKAKSIAEAASKAVSGAIEAAKSALKINSPSKVFIGIGKSVDEGFALGISKNADMAEAPVESMAQRAINNMSDAMSRVTAFAEGGIDCNPTITPVLDLTNIQEGAKAMNGMLGTNRGMALNANVTGIMSRSIGRIQNDSTNNDVVKAVKDLQKTMNNTNGNTYQINGITYDDGSSIQSAVETLIRAAMIERRM